jgi:hypothetical protein
MEADTIAQVLTGPRDMLTITDNGDVTVFFLL